MSGAALADQAARRRITEALDVTLFVEAGAGSGKTRSLVERVVALVDGGMPMRHIAAITFTEKAAAELRDRIRRALEQRAGAEPPGERRFRAALDELDAAAVSTLHGFAQRILSEHPIAAGLPPRVEVLDEVASEIAFADRWRRFRDRLLDAPALQRTLLLGFAAGLRLEDLRHLARRFDDNWDLVADAGRLPWDRSEPPAVAADELAGPLTALLARRGECGDPADLLCAHLTDVVEPFRDQLRQSPDEYETLRLLADEQPKLRCARGQRGNWRDKPSVVAELERLQDRRVQLANQVALACLRRLALEVADFTLAAAAERRAAGRPGFHDLLVLARDLLRGPDGPSLRAQLRRRYQRLLLDEFQDTDPIQVDLAVLLASPDPDAADRPWNRIDVDPGRLFFVGDPKQSVYRFRRADIGLFLQAREVFGEPLGLTTNFRTTPPLIDWVNHAFGRLLTPTPGSQPGYQPLRPAPDRGVPAHGPPVSALGRRAHAEPRLSADVLRAREAAEAADAVLAACSWQVSERGAGGHERWRRARLGDVAVLLPARTSLPALERALDERAIPYRAETSSLVYSTREVRELIGAARALANPTDQLALVATLRSPLFGCGDDDLFSYRVEHSGDWRLHADPPDGLDAGHPVVDALSYLGALHRQLPWLSPSELLDRLIRDRRLLELGYAQGRPRDLWRRLRFVVDQARAWSETEGGTLRAYLDWARLQASESTRVAETVLPETDDDAVRILTVHGAKGLEFPVVVLSGMTTASRGLRGRVEVGFPPGGPVALKVGRGLVSPEYTEFEPIDEQMDFHERLRLLYVACTRARDHLVVSLHRRTRARAPDKRRKLTNAELLAEACADLDLPTPAAPSRPVPVGDGPAAAPPPPPLDDWQAERAACLRASGRPRSVGASALEPRPADGDALDADTAAGVRKQARDLELPPWQKGRYGTAVGRAVHAVLQTVDLDSGAGLPETAAAQAAAEGVLGREADIRRLASAALRAPGVVASRGRQRWRETYVATRVGDRVLEGYVDLLYRGDDGLVVVDYKTASSTADLPRRLDAYRAQGGAYAVIVEGATAEPVARVLFVFLTADGAVELDLPDLAGARREVLASLAAG